ncbi:Cullin binding-domain-containing protein [Plectosphaerella cucumerina]|uniref:Defective in cullin neddylation protein n=1 Tax=Plectosphaerella cucumerina TaxID=40658 RepID=A0A8K0X3K7_9PEZI|nr:Cullin binding-domain-containing protein [Plectosphaerella cucumerina]
MGWKGIKNVLPSKGSSLWSSKSKSLRTRNDDGEKQPKEYYGNSHAGSEAGTPSPIDAELNKLFDSLRSNVDPVDSLGVDSTSAYLVEKLGVNIENAEPFIVMEIVQAPAIGSITRKGFVDGWKNQNGVSTIHEQASRVKALSSTLAHDRSLFKRVYRHTFLAAKEQDQKAISLEYALIYWETLFTNPGLAWSSSGHDWLSLWKEYLTANWTRSINKDMWNQTLEFAYKTLEDGSLSFWSEDGAWPSVIDDFVSWCRESKGIKAEQMDMDA